MKWSLWQEKPKRLENLVFLLIGVCALCAVSSGFKGLNFFEQPADEIIYLRYCDYINHGGLGSYGLLFKEYVQNSQLQLFPNPLRVGFFILGACFSRIFGSGFVSLAYLSLFSYCIFLASCFYFARKYFSAKTSLLFLLLLAFSPIQMAMARRALIESTSTLFVTLSLWLFLDLVLRKKSPLRYLVFVLIYGFAILVKETACLLTVLFLAILLLQKFLFKKEISPADILCVSVFPFALVGLVYLALGGFPYIGDMFRIMATLSKTVPYALLFNSGPWFRYIIDYLILSPWVTLLSIGFIFSLLASKETRPIEFYLALTLILIFFLFDLFAKNVRYAMILDIPMRLLSVLMLERIFSQRFVRWASLLAAACVFMIASFDYATFYNLFLKQGIYDPVSLMLFKATRLIP